MPIFANACSVLRDLSDRCEYMRLDDGLNSFLIWPYFYQRIFSDARSDEKTAPVAAELIVFRTLNMLVTNTTEFSSLPLRCSTSCSHVLKIQFPLPC